MRKVKCKKSKNLVVILADAETKLTILKRKIKEFIASECPMCGHDRLTSLLAKPIISEQAYQKLSNDWVISST